MKTMTKTTTVRAIMMPISTGIELRILGMACPFGYLRGSDLDGIGAHDADHDDLGAGGKLLPRRDGFVFNSAIELANVNFAESRFSAGNRQIDGARRADGSVNAQG